MPVYMSGRRSSHICKDNVGMHGVSGLIQWNGNSGMVRGIVEWWNSGMVEWMHVLYQVHFLVHVGNN